jgi:hypothetical protein
MQDYEKLGVFYLGRRYDLDQRAAQPDLLLYDSKDLLTHAVCVGMTGSGKTGLCIGLLEEAAIDGIPAIVVDPKGDLGNLLLTFPQLSASEFQPWVNADEGRNKGLSAEQFAEEQAARWRKGLTDWHQDADRIARLRESAEFALYTPASNAGRPVSVLQSFAAPPDAVLDDREAMRDRVSATASSLLSLAGIQGDGVQSREHILLSTILDRAWREGKDLDLAAIIQNIQAPPFSKIGVMDIESFYPSKDRFGLAMQINNLLASPGFEAWMEGEPLDISGLLYTPQGRPRIAIFSIAHLNDSERMFFVSLLLNQILGWVRSQSGTTSLRALFYMDEIFGYFPPVANPPSKGPLLTLLKQARAFGLGVVLATQNPADLDYKGLGNTGTWFIGRLQTERDKARLLDGLEGASGNAGGRFDRQRMDAILSGLGSRVFLMNNVHEDGPVVFQTRWTMSYLRGPLTRPEIRRLTQAAPAGPVKTAPSVQSAPAASSARPVLPPDVPQQFVPAHGSGTVVYQPMLLGAAQVHFVDAKAKVDVLRDVVVVTAITDSAVPVNWEEALALDLSVAELEAEPIANARFEAPASAAAKPRNYAAWGKHYAAWAARVEKLTLLKSPSTGVMSRTDETERDFRVRLQQAAREERDAQAEALRRKYAPKVATLQERLRRAQMAQEREAEQARAAKMNVAVSMGTTILGALFGRKTMSATTLGRAGTVARTASRTYKESQDVQRAGETVAAVQQQIDALESELQGELAALHTRLEAATEQFETIEIRPKKTNVNVKLVCLAWVPEEWLSRG